MTSSNCKYDSSAIGAVVAANAGLQSLETSFHQDLNGDGSICFFFNDTATTEIYTLSLHDALPISDSISTGTGPSLKYAGADFAMGQQFGGWTPIATEQTASG